MFLNGAGIGYQVMSQALSMTRLVLIMALIVLYAEARGTMMRRTAVLLTATSIFLILVTASTVFEL